VIEGIYYEFIGLPCGARASMPLGVVAGDQPTFFVYKGSRLYGSLSTSGTLRLLSPRDPLLFVKSLRHELEQELQWSEGCPAVDESLGAWYDCRYRLLSLQKEGSSYVCDGIRYLGGLTGPFTRTYGCLVELLVLLTKARAGVWEEWFLPYAKGLTWCVERSSRGSEKYVNAALEVLRELEGIRGKAEGRP